MIAGATPQLRNPPSPPPVVKLPEQPSGKKETETKLVASESELVNLAGAMMDMKRFDEAITALTLALSQNPNNGIALANRALAYGWTNRVAEAKADLARVEQIIPNDAIVYRIKAIIANRQSDRDAELLALTKSLEIEPGNGFARSFRASIYLERRQYEAALADADAFIKSRPNEPEAYSLKGWVLFEQRKFGEARKVAEQIMARFAGDQSAQTVVAQLFQSLGERDRAMAAINRAIELNDTFYRTWRVSAQLRRKRDFSGRRFDLTEAIALAPGDLSVEAELGLLDFDEGKWSDAHRHFDNILAKDDRDYGALAYRAMVKHKQGDALGAVGDYNRALAVASGPGDFKTICWAFAREKLLLDWALETCDRAVKADGDRVSFRINRGLARLQRGENDAAIEDYEKAISLDPSQGDAFYGRGIARLRKGDPKGALEDRAWALSLQPTVEEDFEDRGLAELADAQSK